MKLEGDRVVDHPINNSLESNNTDSQCNPEAQLKKKKRKRKLKDKDASIHIHGETSKLKDELIGTNSCHDSLLAINTETDFYTAALYIRDSQSNPAAEYPQPMKKKKRRKVKDKDASIDIHGETSTLKEDSIGTNSCPDALTIALPVLGRTNNSSESHNIDSHFNSEAEYPQPKKKKRKRKLKDKVALVDIYVDTCTLKDYSIGTDSFHDSLAEINAQTEFKTGAFPVLSLSKNNNSLESHNVDSQCNPGFKCPQPKKKKKKRKVKDKNDSIETNSCHDSSVKINATTQLKTAAVLVLSKNNTSLESLNIDFHCNPEADCPHEKKKKGKRKLKDKDVSIGIHGDTASMLKDDSVGTNSCRDSLLTVSAETDLVTAALPVLSLSRNCTSLESQNIDSQCNPHSLPKKKKVKRRRKDKDASVDLHVDPSTLKDDLIERNSCQTESILLPALRSNGSLESHYIYSHSNLEAKCRQPKIKKRKREMIVKDALIDVHGDTTMLKDDSVRKNSCHDSLAEINVQNELKTTGLSVLSSNNNRSGSNNVDSHCNPEAECTQPKKKKKRKLKETNFNTAALPVLSRNNNNSESHNIDSHCNPDAECPQAKEKKGKRKLKAKDAPIDIRGDTYTMKDDSIGTNSCHDSLAETNTRTELKVAAFPLLSLSRNNNSLESHNIDSYCNLESECPQPKKKKKRKIHGDTSTLKDDSVGTNSCHDSVVEINAQAEFEITALPVSRRNNNSLESHNIDSHCNPETKGPQPKKKKRRKLKDKDALVDIHGDTSMPKDDSIGTNSCHDSLAEIYTQTELKTAAFPILSLRKNYNCLESHSIDSHGNLESECSQPKKKKKKRKMKDKDALIDLQVDTSMPKDDLIGTNSCHDSFVQINETTELETAEVPLLSRNTRSLESHYIDSQCNSEAKCPQPKKKKSVRKLKDKDASVDSHVATSKLKDDSVVTNSCRDSLVEINNAQTDSKTAALPALSRGVRKMRKKQQLDSSGITDKVHVSGTQENALISEKQSDSLGSPSIGNKHNGDTEMENSKKKRKVKRKKQNLDTSLIYDNAHHPHVDVDAVGMRRDGLLSEKQNDPRSPSVNMVNKHDNGDEGAFISDGNENAKKRKEREKKKLNTSVISDKAHVPPAELDRKRRKSSKSKEIKQPITVAEQASSKSDELYSTKISDNEVEGVQAGKVAAYFSVMGNVLAEKTSDSSNVDFKCPESKDILEIKERKRKKQKMNSSEITDKVHISLTNLDLTGTDENALIGNKHNGDTAHSVVETENIKKKRKKKKRDASVICDNAHPPHADADAVGIRRDGLLSEKKNDPRSPSGNMVGKHDEGSFISGKKRKRVKKKLNATVISDKAHVPPAELEENEKLEDNLVTMAAEAIVSLSSTEIQKGDSLYWFAKLASSVVDDPESKFGIGLSCKNQDRDQGIDYFEGMTLQLEETVVEDFYCLPTIIQVEAACPARGRARKGRQRPKNFQRDVLPRIARLSRNEVNEDLRALGVLTEASQKGRNKGTRGRRGRSS